MIRYLFIIMLCSLPVAQTIGQVYRNTAAKAIFEVKAPAKTIEGESHSVSININFKSGAVLLKVPVQSFLFHNNFIADTMNEVIRSRFNSYYLESSLFPEVVYSGTLLQPGSLKPVNGKQYTFRSSGKLLLHGVAREVTTEGTLDFRPGSVTVNASITLQPGDYGIRIPSYIGNMYFRQVEIKVRGVLTSR
jgi:hypothetical protein